jgi:hypothetical protein
MLFDYFNILIFSILTLIKDSIQVMSTVQLLTFYHDYVPPEDGYRETETCCEYM